MTDYEKSTHPEVSNFNPLRGTGLLAHAEIKLGDFISPLSGQAAENEVQTIAEKKIMEGVKKSIFNFITNT